MKQFLTLLFLIFSFSAMSSCPETLEDAYTSNIDELKSCEQDKLQEYKEKATQAIVDSDKLIKDDERRIEYDKHLQDQDKRSHEWYRSTSTTFTMADIYAFEGRMRNHIYTQKSYETSINFMMYRKALAQRIKDISELILEQK